MSCGDADTLPQADQTRRQFDISRGRFLTGLALRFAVPAVALGVFLVLGVLYALHSAIAFDALRWWGVHPPVREPFLDLRYIFAGVECWAKGVNVYISNPCDPLGRPHGYSPLWLRFVFLPSQNWTAIVGLVVDLLFVLSLGAFPSPQSRNELAVMLAAALSPPVVFALQRANVDVLIFLMLLAAVYLSIGRMSQRILGYGLVTFAGFLKFYPLIALALAVREKLKTCIAILGITGILLIGFTIYFHTELVEMARNIPTGGYFIGDMFGAKNFPDGITAAHFGTSDGWFGVAAWSVLLALTLAIAVATFLLLARRHDIVRLAPLESALLLSGATVICGCFFAGQSVGYRGIFLLFPVPGLLALHRRSSDRAVRRLAAQAITLTLFVLWQGTLTWNVNVLDAARGWLGAPVAWALWMALWSARELAWWLLAGILSGIILCFVVGSPATDRLRRALERRSSIGSP